MGPFTSIIVKFEAYLMIICMSLPCEGHSALGYILEGLKIRVHAIPLFAIVCFLCGVSLFLGFPVALLLAALVLIQLKLSLFIAQEVISRA